MPDWVVAEMYEDYLRLRSIEKVAELWDRSRQTVWEGFRKRGFNTDVERLKPTWPNPQPQPVSPLKGPGVTKLGGFEAVRRFAKPINAGRTSRVFFVKPKRRSRAIAYMGMPYYWTDKGFYRAGTGDRRPLHHIIWEDHHGRGIPHMHEIFVRDRDRHNFSPENLELLHKAEVHRRILDLGEISPVGVREAQGRKQLALMLQRYKEGSSNEGNHQFLKFLGERREKYSPQAVR